MNWKKNHQAEYFNVRGEAPIVFLSGTFSLARFRKVKSSRKTCFINGNEKITV